MRCNTATLISKGASIVWNGYEIHEVCIWCHWIALSFIPHGHWDSPASGSWNSLHDTCIGHAQHELDYSVRKEWRSHDVSMEISNKTYLALCQMVNYSNLRFMRLSTAYWGPNVYLFIMTSSQMMYFTHPRGPKSNIFLSPFSWKSVHQSGWNLNTSCIR